MSGTEVNGFLSHLASERNVSASTQTQALCALLFLYGPVLGEKLDWVDSYALEAFSGPVKVFDATSSPLGRAVPVQLFQGRVEAGDVVLVFTRYTPPQTDDATPESRALTHEAAEFLASLPVRAYGTDAFGVEALNDTKMPLIHHSFLSRGIPVYEQLLNLDKLLGKEKMFFVGVPLNIKDGDGMMVRPVVFVY